MHSTVTEEVPPDAPQNTELSDTSTLAVSVVETRETPSLAHLLGQAKGYA